MRESARSQRVAMRLNCAKREPAAGRRFSRGGGKNLHHHLSFLFISPFSFLLYPRFQKKTHSYETMIVLRPDMTEEER